MELDDVLCKQMGRIIEEVYWKCLRILLKSKLNSRNLFMAINSLVVAVIRYSAAIVGWTKEEMRNLNQVTRKLLYKFKAVHPKSNIDRLYTKRNNGGRDLISIEKCVANKSHNLH